MVQLMQKKEEISFEYKKKNVEENESLKEENKRLEKELEELEDKYALLLEENARYFNLIALLKKENRELAEKTEVEKMTRDLIIINGRCFEITNLGWNPKQLNPQLKAMCEGKDLRTQFLYVKKNSDDRKAYTKEQLAKIYQLGICEPALQNIIDGAYETFEIEADWNEEFPGSNEIVFED